MNYEHDRADYGTLRDAYTNMFGVRGGIIESVFLLFFQQFTRDW